MPSEHAGTERRRVVALGGTFDPVHAGHLAILDQVRRSMGAEEAWLLPTATPPHRRPAHAPATDRLAMVEAAARGLSGVRVVDIELRRGGLSYTIDTLDQLEELFPDRRVWLILGADAAREVGSWHRAADVLARGWFVLVNRSGVPPIDDAEALRLGFAAERTRVLSVDSPAVSATEIRRRVAAAEPIEGLVPPAVAELIAARGLYRPGQDPMG
jgi:nicotinate-nucleotide adenylyltransferase